MGHLKTVPRNRDLHRRVYGVTTPSKDGTESKLSVDASGDRGVGSDIAEGVAWERVTANRILGLWGVVPDHEYAKTALGEKRAAHEVAVSSADENDVVRIGDHE